jgi:hypothetical protein
MSEPSQLLSINPTMSPTGGPETGFWEAAELGLDGWPASRKYPDIGGHLAVRSDFRTSGYRNWVMRQFPFPQSPQHRIVWHHGCCEPMTGAAKSAILALIFVLAIALIVLVEVSMDAILD